MCESCNYRTTDTYTIEVWNDITGHCPECKQVGGEFEPTTLDLNMLTEFIIKRGFKARVEQTGGGCATIYVGDADQDDYYLVSAGPGYFDGANWTNPRAFWEEFCWGLDDDGVTQPTFENDIRPLEDIADEMVALARKVEATRNA